MLVVALLVVTALAAVPAAADNPLAGDWRWPADGRLTQRYGCTGARTNGRVGSCRHFHNGIDIANRGGTPIRAARAGSVDFVGYNRNDPPGEQAWIVILDHGRGVRTWYAHLKPVVAPGARRGQRVDAGDVIGYMGATGRATGVHLHFAVELRGGFVDPQPLLRRDRGGPTPDKPKATPRPAPKATPRPAPKATPRPAPKATPSPTPTATPHPASTEHPAPELAPTPAPTEVVVFRAPLIWLPSTDEPATDTEPQAEPADHLLRAGVSPR
jgi:hypothetical protein